MNIVIYVLCFTTFINFLLVSLAIARLATMRKSLVGLDWEAVATLLGDVAVVKRSVTKLNGRLNGMNNEGSGDWKQKVEDYLTQPKPIRQQGG
ncbi:MAG: hypothetical protein VW972_06715 [Flavobacteriaceae bacterium]